MRRFLFVLVILILAIWAGLKIAADPGYALFVYQQWSVEMPLWLALALMLLGFAVLYGGIRVLMGVGYYHQKMGIWLVDRKKHKAHQSLGHGIEALIEGDAKRAERYLLQHIDVADIPLIHYLMAAKAAHQLGAEERRAHYFRLAQQADPSAEVAIGLSQVALYLKQKSYHQALPILTVLNNQHGHHGAILKSLCHVQVALENWSAVRQLLPALNKRQVFDAATLAKLAQQSHVNELATVAEDSITTTWQVFSRQIKRSPRVVAAYVTRLIQVGRCEEAESLLRGTLKKTWDDELVQLYGKLGAEASLPTALRWLKQHGDNAHLHACLAALSAQASLWGQAKGHYEKSLSLGASNAVRVAYADFLEQQGESAAALVLYKQVCQS